MSRSSGVHPILLSTFLKVIIGGMIPLVFLGGCLAVKPVLVSEEPELIISQKSDNEEDKRRSGKQEASISLTLQATAQIREGKLDEALSILQKAIALYSSNPYAYYYLAKVRYLQGDYLKTLPPLGKAELYLKKEVLWLSWIYDLRGKSYEALFRSDEARAQYELSLSNNPGNLQAREGMIRLGQDSSE